MHKFLNSLERLYRVSQEDPEWSSRILALIALLAVAGLVLAIAR